MRGVVGKVDPVSFYFGCFAVGWPADGTRRITVMPMAAIEIVERISSGEKSSKSVLVFCD